MSHFIWDNTALPAVKSDTRPPRAPSTEVSATDLNTLRSALADIRDTHQTGELRPNPNGATGVSSAGTSRLRHNGGLLQASVEGGAFQSVIRELQFHNALDHGAVNTAVNRSDNSVASSTDSGPAIQAVIDAAVAAKTNLGYLPAGDYYVNTRLEMNRLNGFKLIGAGSQVTRIYAGPALDDQDVLTLRNCQNCEVSGIEFTGRGNPFRSSTTQAAIATAIAGSLPLPCPKSAIACIFDYGTGPTGLNPYVYAPNNNHFRDIAINVHNSNGEGNMLRYGIRFDFTDVAHYDLGNSENLLDRCFIACCYGGATYFNGTQCKMNIFRDCIFFNSNNYGVWCQQGQFHWLGGTCTAAPTTGVAFVLGAANDTIVIQGCSVESQGRFIDSSVSNTRNSWPLFIVGNRIDCSELAVDNVLMNFYQLGPTIILGNEFFGIQSAARSPLIKFTSTFNATYNVVRFENNQILGPKTPIYDMTLDGYNNVTKLTDRNNSYVDLDGSVTGSTGTFARVENGEFTIADAATGSGTISFVADTHDTKYRISLEPVAVTGSPAAGAFAHYVTRTKSGFTVTLTAAPGAGTSITYAWKMDRG
jgi:hypothetical protein